MKLRILLTVCLLFLCEVLSAQTHHYQYAHDTLGNRTSRVYQGTRAVGVDIDTTKTGEPSVISTKRSEWRNPEAESDIANTILGNGNTNTADKDTTKYGLFVKSPAEKQDYLDSMMAAVMALEPLTGGRGTRNLTDYSVGAIPLEYGVSDSGARTYSVPIFTAPDIKYAPSLSLVYNSQGGYGYGGYGWDIAGLSSITLVGKCPYWDDAIQAPSALDSTGVFCLDGVRLVTNDDVATASSYPLVTATGHILVAPYRGASGFITSFYVLYPDGSRALFGIGSDLGFTLPSYPILEMTNINQESIKYTYYLDSANGNYNIKEIKYGFDSNGTASGKIVFYHNFITRTNYYAGKERQRHYIVRKIVSQSGSYNLYSYDLTYEEAAGEYLLTDIALSNINGEQLPFVSFTYGYDLLPQNSEASLTPTDTLYLSSLFPSDTSVIYRRGKFIRSNYNDGLMAYENHPIYRDSTYRHYVCDYPENAQLCYMGSISNESQSHSFSVGKGFQTAEAVDIDGDGIDEIVQISCDTTYSAGSNLKICVFKCNASNGEVQLLATHIVPVYGSLYINNHYYPYNRAYRWGDFVGNGKTQLLVINYTDNGFSEAQTPISTLIDLQSGQKLMDTQYLFQTTPQHDKRLLCIDIDGDGRTEVCKATSEELIVFQWKASISGFSQIKKIDGITRDIIDSDDVYYADVNADGYIDIIQAPTSGSYWTLYLNTGLDFISHNCYICQKSAGDRIMFLDIDRDGYSDLIRISGFHLYFHHNRGGSAFAIFPTTETSVQNGCTLLPANIINYSAASGFITIFGQYVYSYEYSRYAPPLRHLVQSRDSYGKIVRNTYGYLPKSSLYWTDNPTNIDASQGYRLRVLPLYVLTGAAGFLSDESGAQRFLNETYSWYDGVVHTQGLGFCGFSKTRTASDLDNVYHNTISIFNPQKRGVPVSVSLYSRYINHGALATTTYSYDNNTFNGKLAPRLTQTAVTKSIDGVLSTTDYTYGSGNFDFPTKVTTLKSCTINGAQVIAKDIVETTYQHSNITSRYVLGIVSSQDSFHDRDGDGISKMGERVVYTRDTLFRPITQYNYKLERVSDNSQPTAHLSSTDRWQYDSHGNVIREESAPAGSNVFVGTSYAYDGAGRHLVSSTDALGHTTTYSGFDAYGNPSTITNHKGQQTHSYRDGWGRVTRTVHPDGTIDSLARAWGGTGVYQQTAISSGAPDAVVDYDAAGREVLRSDKRFDGQWQKTQTRYNQRGLTSTVSLPYRGTSPTYWTTYTYDEYGRLGLVSEPSGRKTRWKRTGTTVTETKDNIKTIKKTGPDGALRTVSDSLSTFTYFYRDDGQPMLLGKTGLPATTFTYDTLGRRTSIVDPSAGTRSTSYITNANGSSTITESNALGSITTHYDSLGRVSSIIRPDFNTAFTYDTCGRLVSKVSTNGTLERYTYDQYDRPLTAKDSVPGGKWLQKGYTYNSDGTLSIVSYTNHNGYITSELYYYANGHNHKTTLPDGTVIYQLTAENDLGQPTAATSAGVSRTYGYSEYGMPTYRKMNGGLLMNHSYSFDAATGNLLSRSRTYNGNTTTESFSYDNLGRLTAVGNDAIIYDADGNITSKGGVGTMDYGSSAHPYRITDLYATSTSGTGTSQQTVTYTAYDRPATLSQGDKSATFTYDADHDRVRTHISRWGENIDRYYIGGRYEINDDDQDGLSEWLYLGGDAYTAPMMLYKGQGWTQWQPYVIGRDYLGSINVLASGGSLQSGGNFDAWGKGNASFYINRGFCGHEHLDDFGLINMNARLYDPVLGRFLSPDPYIQAPDFPGNFNRYAYCLNNPLKYTDESGTFIFTALAALLCPPLIPIALSTDFGWLIGGIRGANTAGMNFWEGAWRGGIVGMAGGMLAQIGGGPLLFNLLCGIGEGALVGTMDAELWVQDPKKGALYGAITGGVFASFSSGFEAYSNYTHGYGFKTNSGVIDALLRQKDYQRAINYIQYLYDMGFDSKGKPIVMSFDPSCEDFGITDPLTGNIVIGPAAMENASLLKATMVHEYAHTTLDRITNESGAFTNWLYGEGDFDSEYQILRDDGPIGYANEIFNAGVLHINPSSIEKNNPMWNEWNKTSFWYHFIPMRFKRTVKVKYY